MVTLTAATLRQQIEALLAYRLAARRWKEAVEHVGWVRSYIAIGHTHNGIPYDSSHLETALAEEARWNLEEATARQALLTATKLKWKDLLESGLLRMALQ